ncbi:MAG: sulfite oxidase [Burkholderiales bacterium]|nr:sulfite oxidase [Burkholderiales bacterium]
MGSKKSDTGITVDHLRATLQDAGARPDTVEQFDEFASRRRFLRNGSGLALLGMGVGSEIAMQGLFGRGLIPVAWGQDKTIPGKPGMMVYNTRPYNGEFHPHELDDEITPFARHFVRNNGLVPERAEKANPQGWTLTIDGEVRTPLKITLDELKRHPAVTYALLIECGGNGRGLFNPPVRGNQWKRGAVGCAKWTGVPLAHLLRAAELKPSAVYTGHYGEDPALSGSKPPLSRGVPIDKAMEEHTLVAYAMNGADIPAIHGYPVRLVVPGWIGSCSQKWLNRIWVRDREHDGPKMTGASYRVPSYPPKPGAKVDNKDMLVAKSWVIKSMITSPAPDVTVKVGAPLAVRGFAWAGDRKVDRVMISTDYGVHWHEAELSDPANPYAWNRWNDRISFAKHGYYEIWARAFDEEGDAQPFDQPWNPRGYLGNVIHRVPVNVV